MTLAEAIDVVNDSVQQTISECSGRPGKIHEVNALKEAWELVKNFAISYEMSS